MRLLALLLLVSGTAVVLAAAPSAAKAPEEPVILEPVVQGIDPTAEANATITGLVRGPQGALIDNVKVEAVPASDPLAEPLASALTYAGGANRHGHYALKVPAGSYLVRFSSPDDSWQLFSTRYHGGGAGTPVSVVATATEVLPDFTMVDAAQVVLTGRVLSDTGAALTSTSVQLHRRVGGEDGWWSQIDHAQTDANGRYRFDNAVRDRRLTVVASPYGMPIGQAPLMPTWLGDVTDRADAASVVMPSGSDSLGVDDIRMRRGSLITGQVNDGTTTVSDVEVTALARQSDGTWDRLGSYWWSGTGGVGTFQLGPVAPGTDVTLRFDSQGRFATAYLGGGTDLTGAHRVTTVAGRVHDVGSTTLVRTSSRATGRVLNDAGRPVADASVSVLQQVTVNGRSRWNHFDTLTSDPDGVYHADLPWGHAYTASARYDDVVRFLGGSTTREEAADFSVAAGSATTVIDDIVVPVPTRASLSGKVVHPDGVPGQGNVNVWRWDSALESWQSVNWATLAADGSYRVGRLDPGAVYTVSAHPFMGGIQTWLGNVTVMSEADPVTLPVEGGHTTLPDLVLQPAPDGPGGVIAGTISPAAGQELDQSVNVELSRWVDSSAGSYLQYSASTFVSRSSSEGPMAYRFTGLQPGAYAVRVTPSTSSGPAGTVVPRHASTWLGGTAPTSPAHSNVINLVQDQKVTDADVTLQRGVLLSGTVTDESGVSVVGASVGFTVAHAPYGSSGTTDSGGRYAFRTGASTTGSIWVSSPWVAYSTEALTTGGTDLVRDLVVTRTWGSVGAVAGERNPACMQSQNGYSGFEVGGTSLTATSGVITRLQDQHNGARLDPSSRTPMLAPLAGSGSYYLPQTWGKAADGRTCVMWSDNVATVQAWLEPTADGGLDVTYNYDKVSIGGGTATAGWTHGTGTSEGYAAFAGAGVPGGYEDTNTETGLIHHSFGSTRPGQYKFHFTGFRPLEVAPRVQRQPAITGDLWPGGTVTVDDGTWALDGDLATGLTHTYTWMCWNGMGVLGDSATVTLPADCANGQVQVTATKPGHETASTSTYFSTLAGPPAASSAAAPTISPEAPEVAQTLTVDPGQWEVQNGTAEDLVFTTEWWRNGRRLVGTGDTYTVIPADGGNKIVARVTASRDGHEPAEARSAAVLVADTTNLAQATPPTISGTPQVGGTLTAVPGTVTPADADPAFSYVWRVAGVVREPDPDAPDQLTLKPEDLGAFVSVRVRATDDLYRRVSAVASVGPVLDGSVARVDLNGVAELADGTPLSGLVWFACEKATFTCLPGGRTAADGTFTGLALPSTRYGVTVLSSTRELQDATVEVVTPATGSVTKKVVLAAAPAPPANVEMPGSTGTHEDRITLTPQTIQTLEVTGCATTDPRWRVRFESGFGDMAGSMSVKETLPDGRVVYVAAIPAFANRTGRATILTNVAATCGGEPTEVLVYIDPSGVVTDQYGRPLDQVTVTLLRAQSLDGEFQAVPYGSTIMSSDNRANPSVTDESGGFRWDVTEGWYKVRAEKEGCSSAVSPPMQVNPPRVDLLLTLDCRDNVDRPELSGTAEVGSELSVASDVFAPLEATTTWLRNGEPISGATGTSYRLTADDAGKAISVRQTAQRDTYVQEEGRGAPVSFDALVATSEAVSVAALPTAPTTPTAPVVTTPTTPVVTTSVPATTVVPPVTVAPPAPVAASSTTTVKGKKKQRAGKVVVVIKVSAAAIATGKVKVYDGKKLVATVTLKANHKGVIKVKLKKVKKKGRHKLTAMFAGSGAVKGSKSKVLKLKVT